ncbi:organic solute transporter Ostalpha-domain-containing protein [Microdochium trichocladiopsis]|uniref:Organic solute transporter Ostalpha-domain-containing protein n=1 Tax=Microdochium trichocladiopsis TaxID=1682393 RepID=A0A9P8Y0X9_9PEZI|nr:organic solute transporter Ostalpha-domain-containing protein [Microdochium trichocladiopsis]KAH7027838.1 organic solute transporter Ostalpha-domain-containing protein [Microdochium trichocladiopsis]
MGFLGGGNDGGSGSSSGSEPQAESCLEYLVIVPTQPIAGSYDFFHFNMILSGASCAFVTVTIFILMMLHIRHLSKPREQIHILRLCLFMPVYAVGTLIMVVEPNAYVYLKPWLKLLEGYALAYFFLLVCQMISPEDASDSEAMLAPLLALARQKNMNPQALMKSYRLRWFFIYQAPIVLFIVAIVTDVAQGLKGYCGQHGHPSGSSSKSKVDTILSVVGIVSIMLAVYSAIKSTMMLKRELKPHKGQLKLWAFKALILLQIIQEILFLILTHVDPSPLEPSATLSYVDIEQGLPLLMILLEMVIFALFYHYAYSSSPYMIGKGSKMGGYWPGGWKVWLEILKVNQLFHALTFGFRIQAEYNRLETSYQRGARRPHQRYSEESLVEPHWPAAVPHHAPPSYQMA